MVSPRREKCTLFLSCREIVCLKNEPSFPTGIYREGPLVIVSGQEDKPFTRAQKILDLLWDKEVEDVFVYLAGFSLSTSALKKEREMETTRAFLKIAIAHAEKERIHLVGCHCGLEEKKDFAEKMGMDFIVSDCGGGMTLGKIAASVLEKANK